MEYRAVLYHQVYKDWTERGVSLASRTLADAKKNLLSIAWTRRLLPSVLEFVKSTNIYMKDMGMYINISSTISKNIGE